MNTAPNDLLTPCLITPASCAQLTLAQWDLLIRQARQSNLLGHLAAILQQSGQLAQVPAQPQAHLHSALSVAQRQMQAVHWEVHCIQRALDTPAQPIILLKGAAYILLQLPNAQGRLFSDIDILVPKGQLDEVELQLKMHGWVTTLHDAYDQRYYRAWMHELPPMTHLKRQTFLDVHHGILPETARLHPDAQKLLDAALPVDGQARLKVLAPADMVLHSATHLFHEGEFEKGLRDLCDLDLLMRHYSQEVADFWPNLLARAVALDLERPLFYGMRYATHLLSTPIPQPVMQAAQRFGPGHPLLGLMDALFTRALRPYHASCDDAFSRPARYLLFVRAHWLKMPFSLLLRHLFHKAFISPAAAHK